MSKLHIQEKKALLAKQGNKCAECGNPPEWNGKPLIFQAHAHNRPDVRLLCPNCHSQTFDYSGRALKGRMPWNKGKTLSAEHRERIGKTMSVVLTGLKHSPERRKAQSDRTKGMKRTKKLL